MSIDEKLEPIIKQWESIVKKYDEKLITKTKSIKETIKGILLEQQIPLCGEIAYNIYVANNDDDADKIFNNSKIFVYMKAKQQKELFNEKNYTKNVLFTDKTMDTHSRNIKYQVSHTGINNPYLFDVAQCFIIPDQVRLRTIMHNGFLLVSPDYLFIEYLDLIGQPRETKSLEQWEEIDHRLTLLETKIFSGKIKNYSLSNNRHEKTIKQNELRIKSLEKFFENNKNIICTGDYAISNLIDTPVFCYKILVMTKKFSEVRDAIHKILKPLGYRFENVEGFLVKFHGPQIIFKHTKTGNIALRMYLSSEQCVPSFKLNKLQIARVPCLLKYLFLDAPTPARDVIIKKLFESTNKYLTDNKKTKLDSSMFQFYDIECLGTYVSMERKKRIKLIALKTGKLKKP